MSSENLEIVEVVDSETENCCPIAIWYNPFHNVSSGVSNDGESALKSTDSDLISPLTY